MDGSPTNLITAGHLEGSVDRFDPPRTIAGWVRNSLRIGQGRDITIRIRLCGKIVAEGPLVLGRPDIVVDPDYLVGFSFTCTQDIPDAAVAMGLLTVQAFDTEGRCAMVPLYDQTRSFCLSRALAETEALGRYSASVMLNAIASSHLIPQAAREALLAIDDEHFQEEDRKLLYEFESLGKDRSVGSMHRACGAEPLGLWRFAGIAIDAVIEALETRLAGVGDPEFTRLAPDATGEYLSSDTRYGMTSHTFVVERDKANFDYDEFFRKQCQKIKFLTLNLIEKIESGDKILVIHALPEEIPETKLRRLLSAIRQIGPAPLLYLEMATEEKPPGTVFLRRDGIMIGHVLQIQGELMRPEAEVRDGWKKVFRKARAFISGGGTLDLIPSGV